MKCEKKRDTEKNGFLYVSINEYDSNKSAKKEGNYCCSPCKCNQSVGFWAWPSKMHCAYVAIWVAHARITFMQLCLVSWISSQSRLVITQFRQRRRRMFMIRWKLNWKAERKSHICLFKLSIVHTNAITIDWTVVVIVVGILLCCHFDSPVKWHHMQRFRFIQPQNTNN